MAKTKHDTLTQCKLRHQDLPGVTAEYFRFDVAWINSKLAKHGTRIKFRDLPGIYEVWEVWGTRPREEVELMERSFKNQRSVSDV